MGIEARGRLGGQLPGMMVKVLADHVIGVKFKHGRKIRSGSLGELCSAEFFVKMLMYKPVKKLLSSWFAPSLLHLSNISGYYLDISCFLIEQTSCGLGFVLGVGH